MLFFFCIGSTCCLCLKTTFPLFPHLGLCPFPSLCPCAAMDAEFTVLGFDKLPWWGVLLISIGFGILTWMVVWFAVCPCLKKKIARKYFKVF